MPLRTRLNFSPFSVKKIAFEVCAFVAAVETSNSEKINNLNFISSGG